MNNDNNVSKNIETPSSVLSDELILEIQYEAEEWKNSNDNKERNRITRRFKEQYKDNPEACELFEKYKKGNKLFATKRGSYTPHSEEAIVRQYFADKLKECIKESFYVNENIDPNDGIFLLDENCNLPVYFWTRMNTNVLPKLKKEGCNTLRAWKLGAGIIDRHRDELNYALKNTHFQDLKHVSHVVIQFLNKYMLVTYKELIEQSKKELRQKQKSQQIQADIEKQNLWNNSISKDKKEEKQVVPDIGFDTTGLL